MISHTCFLLIKEYPFFLQNMFPELVYLWCFQKAWERVTKGVSVLVLKYTAGVWWLQRDLFMYVRYWQSLKIRPSRCLPKDLTGASPQEPGPRIGGYLSEPGGPREGENSQWGACLNVGTTGSSEKLENQLCFTWFKSEDMQKQITNTSLKSLCGIRTVGFLNCTDCWEQPLRKTYFGTVNKVQLFHLTVAFSKITNK